ncbi:uncharacterized protein LOC118428709 isoform X1 [Branchiostoma floridae]|uniref:Uncharacterized protein LOC118428709 isoform X1 n=1 Tax=Branchiostoma floridae TaxID=7739 RepID=A0A9J7M5K2_BRAFL|nr:uncharacterized protein LOC118428709 isoform X1 [Branchiostoma floridae]
MASLVRPRSIRSGAPLRDKLAVAHRTDILIKEQVQVIQDLQDSLAKSLQELKNSRSISEVDFHKTQVHILRAKSEEMVLKLQVASKINDELLFAREILKKAIREDKEVQHARDRVEWLEGRIEGLLDRNRLSHSLSSDSILSLADREVRVVPHIQPSLQHSLEKLDQGDIISHDLERASIEDKYDLETPIETLPDDVHSKQMTHMKQKKTKTKRRQKRTTSAEGSTISSDRPYSDILEENERVLQGRLDSEDDVSPVPPTHIRKQERELTLATEATVYPPSSLYSSDEERSEEMSSEESGEESEEMSSTEEEEEEERVMENGSGEADSEEMESSTDPTESAGTDSRQSHQTTDSAHMASHQQAEKRVALQDVKTETPGKLGAADSGVFLTETEELLGGAPDYWSSKHHRYEWNDYANALLEENPLSYHQLGLAVHSSYVEPYVPGSPELPWRPRRKGSDIIDPHRKALDKLSRSLRGMYEKVEQAAESSVQVDPRWSTKDWNQPLAASSLALGSQAATTLTTPGSPPGKMRMPSISRVTGLAPPPSAESVTFPPVDTQRLGTSQSGRITYYPKPVPPPKKKPITRTDRSVEFPRKADIWNETEPQAAEEQPRIVNQGSMRKETQLVLYKPRRKRPRGSAQSMSEIMGVTQKAKKRVALRAPMTLARAVMNMDLLPKGYTDALKLGQTDALPVSSGRSAAASLDSMKADRIQALVNDAMTSTRPEDRRQAAKGLGVLGLDQENVLAALRDMVANDENSKVKYEAAKSLLTLGLWDEPVIDLVVQHIKEGDENTRTDLLRTLASAKNIQFIDKSSKTFRSLHKALHTLCSPKNPSEATGFDAAVCLGYMCVSDDRAKERLVSALTVKDPHKKAKALEVVVRQMNYSEPQVREAILEQLKASPVWKYRAAAAKLITYLGPTFLTGEEDIEHVFQILDRRLWDDPKREVRATVALAVEALNMKTRAYELAERRLEDSSEDVRAQAVITLGTLGVRKERTLRLLLEMLELDSSEYVRLQVVRTFCNLGIVDIRAIRSLRERERGEGPLAREAGKAVRFLTELTNSKSPV